MEAPRFLGALKKNRIRLESFLLHAESPAAAAGFYCIVSLRGCGVPDVQNPWWQHLHVALLVFALNPVELGAVSDHRIPVPSLFQCQSALTAPLCRRASSGFSRMYIPQMLLGDSPAHGRGLGASGLSAELTACLGFVFGRAANPQELLLMLSEPGAGSHQTCCAGTATLELPMSVVCVTVPSA